MAPTIMILKDVVEQELDRKTAFLVRVVRLWPIHRKGEPKRIRLLHMVLKDQEGQHIQAIVEESFINSFKDDIEEHGLYLMKNFRVAVNSEIYMPAIHPSAAKLPWAHITHRYLMRRVTRKPR